MTTRSDDELMAMVATQRSGWFRHGCGATELMHPVLPGSGVPRQCPACLAVDEAWEPALSRPPVGPGIAPPSTAVMVTPDDRCRIRWADQSGQRTLEIWTRHESGWGWQYEMFAVHARTGKLVSVLEYALDLGQTPPTPMRAADAPFVVAYGQGDEVVAVATDPAGPGTVVPVSDSAVADLLLPEAGPGGTWPVDWRPSDQDA